MLKITNSLKIALKSLLSIKLGEVKTENGVLYFDGEGELTIGTEVFVKAEDSDEMAPASDGDYKTEDGKTITVADGKVTDIKEAEIEEDEALVKFNAVKVEMSASYDEIRRNIQEAINAQGINGWIVEAGADFAVVSVWTGEKEVFYRYNLTTNEDGTIVLGDREEVKPAYIPVEEKAEPIVEPVAMSAEDENPNPAPAADPIEDEPKTDDTKTVEERLAELDTRMGEFATAFEKILNAFSGLEGRIADLENKVSKIDGTPAANPVEDEPEENGVKSRAYYLRKVKN